MAYDDDLAERIRELIGPDATLTEKKMFGGLAFLIDGRMAVAASGQGGLLVRVEPSAAEALLSRGPAVPMEMGGRTMAGWLRVPIEHLRTKRQLGRWVEMGTGYARSLGPKKARPHPG